MHKALQGSTDSNNNAIYKHCQATERKRDREISEREKEEKNMIKMGMIDLAVRKLREDHNQKEYYMNLTEYVHLK